MYIFHCFDPCKLIQVLYSLAKIVQIEENTKLLLIFLAYIAIGTRG